MNAKWLPVVLVLATTLCAAPANWNRVSVGKYSIPVENEASWRVDVKAATGVVSLEQFHEFAPHRVAIHLMVFRVALRPEAVTEGPEILAVKLVRQDGLKYQTSMFLRKFSLSHRMETVEGETGKAFVFGNEQPVFADEAAHFAKAALLLPPDYKTRRIAYLVVGHQAGRVTPIGLEQDEAFYAVLKGLRETDAGGAPVASPGLAGL